jgi:hypothetical protein
MATYVGGNGHQTSVLSVDFDSEESEAEFIVHAIDEKKQPRLNEEGRKANRSLPPLLLPLSSDDLRELLGC